jgi:hypothetical protein
MTAGTGGLLAGMGPLDEHVSRLPTTTPINTNPVSPDSSCIPTHSADRSAGWNAGWDDLDGLAGTERYNPSHAMYRNVPGHQLWAALFSVSPDGPYRIAKGILQEHPTGLSPACITVTKFDAGCMATAALNPLSGLSIPKLNACFSLDVAPIITRHVRECQLEQSEQSRMPRGRLHAGLC